MVWLFKPTNLMLVLSISMCCHCANALSFMDFLRSFKSKIEEIISGLQGVKECPAVLVSDGNIVYLKNQTKVDLEDINNRYSIETLTGCLIEFTEFQQPSNNYYLIDLGYVDRVWSTEMFSNFTTIIDNSRIRKNRQRTLFGFTITPTMPLKVETLPYLKASIRDLKRYLLFRDMDFAPIGIRIDPNDNVFIQDNIRDYFKCDNKFNPDFYSRDNRIIDFNSYGNVSYMSNTTALSPPSVNKACENVKINGINTKFIPYSPRSSRCDCIMSMLQCIIDRKKDFSYVDETDLLSEICSTIYCGSIIDDPLKGKYGVFTSCSNIQRYSIAFNLLYTFNNRDSCNFNGKAKLLRGKSIDDYMKLTTYDGKECREEIKEDWQKYITGISKQEGDTDEPLLAHVFEYDGVISEGMSKGNNDLKISLRSSIRWLFILWWYIAIVVMF